MKIQIPLIASYLMKCAMIAMGVYSIQVHDWLWTFASFSGFILSMAPNIIEKRFDIRIPLLLDLAITLVIFFHVGGGVLKMYWTIPFYDKIGHFFASALIAFIALTAVYLLDEYWSGLHMDLRGMIFVAIVFTMAVGVAWEIGEFGIDQFFGTHEQRDLYDTMTDLIVDTIAGVVVAVSGGYSIKSGRFRKRIEGIDESAGEVVGRG
uniref:Inner membrane protein YjdF n=1 Tax=Candidatus Methanogaster sp. ANME-2c ERB4 TaxID=2759911 RepID=A0A7G9Y1Q2_9EURY|nr:hypothetical protein ENJCFOFA_00018 [Methanosarcinales archaeon ANME-2c ERB4]QNO41936.1 hypothetical protein NBIEPGBJ_00001 [Methanosarcinales archaeon ANME-2c ERB4]QNO48255.1 hypothetical protein FILMCLBC_00001 [Methanosarcinales archaeon ANME-2c ERB4]